MARPDHRDRRSHAEHVLGLGLGLVSERVADLSRSVARSREQILNPNSSPFLHKNLIQLLVFNFTDKAITLNQVNNSSKNSAYALTIHL